jgi:hypothetical protein
VSKTIGDRFEDDARTHQLGRVVVNFQVLETFLAFHTWHLIPTDPKTGAIITSQLSFDRLLTVFHLLMKEKVAHVPALAEQLAALSSRAAELEQQRNTLMHSAWASDESGNVSRLKWSASRRKGLNIQAPDTSIDEIRGVADDLRDLGSRIGVFAEDVRQAGLISFPTRPPNA